MRKLFLLLVLALSFQLTTAQTPARHLGGVILGAFSADPTGVKEGQIYWNDVSEKFRYYDGTVWADLGGAGGTINIEDEGVVTVTSASILNFVGSAVTVTDAGGGEATITIVGGTGESTSVSDTATVDLTLTGSDITADVIEAALTITESQISDLTHTVDTDDQTAVEVPITDVGGIITATEVEGALQEIKAAVDLNTAKVTNTDSQVLDVSQLVGTDLQLSLSGDGEATKVIDLSSLQDGTGTDDQTASEVNTNTAGFNGNLSGTDTTVQLALDTLDDLPLQTPLNVYSESGTIGGGDAIGTIGNIGGTFVSPTGNGFSFDQSNATVSNLPTSIIKSDYVLLEGTSALYLRTSGGAQFAFLDTSSTLGVFDFSGNTASRTYDFPDVSGVIALTSDIIDYSADDTPYGVSWNGNLDAATKNAIYDKIETLSGGASQLSDLSDVNTSTPTNRNVLVADGVDWESRALTEADISDLGTYGDVFKVGTPVDNQIGVWTGDGTLEGNSNFTVDSSLGLMSLGVDDSFLGQLYLYGGAGSSGAIRIYNHPSYDSNVDHWRFQGSATNGNFYFTADGVPFLTADDVTLGMTAPNTSTADIDALGAKALITKEYADANYSGSGGSVTSVAISGTDGIEVDSGSPITTSGTIQLGLSASTLTSLGLADSALQSEVDGSTTNELNTSVTMTAGSLGVVDAGGTQSVSLISTDGGNTITAGADGKLYSAAGAGESTTVSDTAEIDLTLTGSDITADIVTGSIDVLKLDSGVQTSLGLADSALQSEVDGSTTNEIQNLSNANTGVDHTLSISSGVGTLKLAEGTNINLVTSGTAQDAVVTINSTASGADGLGTDGDKGDITVGGTGTTLTIDNDAVTYAKMQNSSVGFTVLGKTATGSGDFAEIVAGTDGVLRRSGTGNLSFGSLVTNNYGNNTVSLGKMSTVATQTFLGRNTAATGNVEALSTATAKTMLNLSGTNSGDQTSIVGITGTKAQFDTALTDGDFLYVGDVTSNATHTGEVTGATALTIASGVVDSDNITNGTIDEVDLDASVNASLGLADSSVQQTGTPITNQVARFSSSGVITGDAFLTATDQTTRLDLFTARDVLRLSGGGVGTYIDIDSGNSNVTVFGDGITADSFVKSGGTSSQFLKADGTTDSNTYLTGNQSITLSGDISGTGTTAITTTIGVDAVDIPMLSATGTASGTTYLRGDNTWATIPAGGDVSKVGTPVDNQGAFWTGDGTLEGEPNFTYNGSSQFDFGQQIQIDGRVIADASTDAESMFKLEVNDVNKFALGNELGLVGTGTNNDVVNYVYNGALGSWSVWTSGLNRFQINGSGEAQAFVSMESPDFIDTDGTTSTTGTVLDLSDNITGKIYNEVTPSTATAFTTTNLKTGGFAYTYINSASEPTVNGSSTETGGSVFEPSTLMKLVAYSPDGTTVEHFFVSLGTPSVGGVTELSKTITIESPRSAEDISIFFTNKAITVTEIRAITVGIIPSTTWTIKHDTNRSASGNAIITAGTTTTSQTSGNDLTSFDDATILADSFIWLETTAQSGVVKELSITIFYTED